MTLEEFNKRMQEANERLAKAIDEHNTAVLEITSMQIESDYTEDALMARTLEDNIKEAKELGIDTTGKNERGIVASILAYFNGGKQ